MISNIIRNFSRKEKKEEEEDISVAPYLEFRSSTPMTITPFCDNTGATLQYSLDTVTWTNITSYIATPSANIIYFRGRASGTKSLYANPGTMNAWTFAGATNLKVYGNITMLVQNSLGANVPNMPLGANAFSYMFYNCNTLVKPPKLPATTLATSCYTAMFYKCVSLVKAPVLPATTLAINCYNTMFSGCTSLTTATALPSTTLTTQCYKDMFQSCISLTTLPALPATKLASYCYANMFSGCTKIKLSTTKTGNYQTEYRVPTVGTGVTASNALNTMFGATGGTFQGTPTITLNTTYYTENQVM